MAVEHGNTARLWALVTDGGRGRVFEMARAVSGLAEVVSRESPSIHKTEHELLAGARGRNRSGLEKGGHAVQPRSDARDEVENRFAAEWVDFLKAARTAQKFERLVLVADPRTLGRLRPALGAELEACVIAEDAHDLTHVEKPDLERRLRELAGWQP